MSDFAVVEIAPARGGQAVEGAGKVGTRPRLIVWRDTAIRQQKRGGRRIAGDYFALGLGVAAHQRIAPAFNQAPRRGDDFGPRQPAPTLLHRADAAQECWHSNG